MPLQLATNQFAALLAEWEAAPFGTKGRVIDAWAATTGRSRSALAREIARRAGRTRSPRADAGQYSDAEEAAYQEVLTCIMKHSPDAKPNGRGRWYPTEMAVAKCERDGRLEPGEMSVSKFHRMTKRVDGRRLRNASHRFEAERSNELHQIDSSGSEYLRPLERDGDDWVLEITSRSGGAWKNKRTGERMGLWITNVVDDHSRVVSGRYSCYPGESATMVIEALMEIWGAFDSLLALQGIPEHVYCDHGPFQNSAQGKAFAESLGFEFLGARPGNSRARGKVEGNFRTMWRRFEMDLLGREGEHIKLSELNELYVHYLAQMQAKSHPWYRDQSRLDVYLAGLGEVRALPDDAAAAAFNTEDRYVRPDRLVWYRNGRYEAPGRLVRQRIKVHRMGDGRLVGESADGETFDLEPYELNRIGEFSADKLTLAERANAAAADQTYSITYDERPAQTHVVARPSAPVENASPIAQHDRGANFANAEEAKAAMASMIGCAIEDMSAEAQRLVKVAVEHSLDRRWVLRDA